MSMLTVELTVRQTEKNARRDLFSFQGKYTDLVGQDLGRASLNYGQSKTLVSTKVLCVYFTKPTVIQLTIGQTVSTVEINGAMVIPAACAITVSNNSGTTTDPLVFHYVVA